MLKTYLTITNTVHRFRRDMSGATAIEYGLLLAGVAIVIGLALVAVGDDVKAVFEEAATLLG
jgi:pilus assembly protein Flp/PilA